MLRLEPVDDPYPTCPPTPVPKYMSPAVKPLVETLTAAILISSTMLLIEVQALIVLLASIRTKLLVAPSGQFTETISELLLGLKSIPVGAFCVAMVTTFVSGSGLNRHGSLGG